MIRFLRAGAALAAVLALSACSSFQLPSLPKFGLPAFGRDAAPAAAKPQLAPGQWPQSRSDVPADPDIRFGALPNGMRYAIRRQATPAGQAALRLHIDAGSIQEDDDQQGLAHFLEHMAFNGSKAVPEGEMVRILERLGLAFGADTNASTDLTETIYKLDLPRTDDETVDASLMLLREAASNLTIDPGAVDRERGVVLSEERARDTPPYRIYKSRMEFLLPGQRPPTRHTIGKVEVLQSAPAARIADFYRRYYRPERAVLVAAGDFDPTAMEAKIRARFGDWQPEGPAGTDPDLGPVKPRRAEAKVAVEAGARPSLEIAWVRPPDKSPDDRAHRRRELIENLGFRVLNRRFSQIARAPTPPFLRAGAFESDQYDAAEVTMITVSVDGGRWRDGLMAAEQEQRRILEHGVRQDELDREIIELKTLAAADAAGAATRRPADLAGEIVSSLGDDRVVTSPAWDLEFIEAAVKDLKAETVTLALRAAFRGQGPLVFVTSPVAIAGGEGAVLAALEASRRTAVDPAAAPSVVTWPYESFGVPGQVVEEREVADLDTVLVRFANGVRLTVKPTRFTDDEVLIRVNIGGGYMDLAPDRTNPSWASPAFVEGGLKQISAEDMERVLASKVYGGRFAVAEDAFVLSAETRPEDLPTQMQVLAAYLSEPGWRPEAFERLKAGGRTIHDQYESTTSGVLSRDLGLLIHAGDRRWAFPSREEIAAGRLEDFKAAVTPALASGPVEVVIVGDVTVENAIQAVAATFGALPQRPEPVLPPAAQRRTGFPAPVAEPVVLTHKGRADQAIGYMAWPTTDYHANPQRALQTAVMGEVLGLRLIDELRESQGATYSPGVNYRHSFVWPGWGYVSAQVEVPPEKLDAFFADVRKIVADLRTREITADELARAKQPRLERIERARVTNGYWVGELSGAHLDPRRLDATRAAVPGTERVTPADVKRAAETFLVDDKAWMLVVRPQGR